MPSARLKRLFASRIEFVHPRGVGRGNYAAPSTSGDDDPTPPAAPEEPDRKTPPPSDTPANPNPVAIPPPLKWPIASGDYALHGLINVGTTCYVNAVLQCLAHTPALLAIMSRCWDATCPKYWSATRFCAYCALASQVKWMVTCNPALGLTPRAPLALLNNMAKICPRLRLYRNEDAHEYLRALLALVDEASVSHAKIFERYGDYVIPPPPEDLPGEEATPPPARSSVAFAIFGGYLCSEVQCGRCGRRLRTYDPFMDLAIDSDQPSVDHALLRFCESERLGRENQIRCRACRQLANATKRLSIKTPPNVLTLQLKVFNVEGRKTKSRLHYPTSLDLGPYLSEAAAEGLHRYALYAILLHHGSSTRFGHYTALVRSPKKCWVSIDDESPSPVVDPEHVLAQPDAYLLFYARKRPADPTPRDASQLVQKAAVTNRRPDGGRRAHNGRTTAARSAE